MGLTSANTSTDTGDFLFSKSDELRLREHISSLKSVRASILGSLVEVDAEKGRSASLESGRGGRGRKKDSEERQTKLEHAVMKQEIMASRWGLSLTKNAILLAIVNTADFCCLAWVGLFMKSHFFVNHPESSFSNGFKVRMFYLYWRCNAFSKTVQ